MPHVSRRKLHIDALDQLFDKLGQAITNLKSRTETDLFFNDLLTHTEKIMLAKRLAIVFLLEKEFTFAQISSILKVSEGTIFSMRERLDRGGKGFRLIIQRLEKDRKVKEFFEKIEDLFETLSPPPKIGKGRWKNVLYMKK